MYARKLSQGFVNARWNIHSWNTELRPAFILFQIGIHLRAPRISDPTPSIVKSCRKSWFLIPKRFGYPPENETVVVRPYVKCCLPPAGFRHTIIIKNRKEHTVNPIVIWAPTALASMAGVYYWLLFRNLTLAVRGGGVIAITSIHYEPLCPSTYFDCSRS